ncbi:hypothetical protein AGDE_13641 [Angomonas deanei]|uniref:Uncharacterized protein n=1 Tax=Angomonas deanei TaxID=59799 RepID=A0A7G2C816_9TRYP|nr:hypothetical protein AGDE_13641 [Angomonas deanei]CAD2215244.1 hypothetical protein, conserved [Angomonas deanei]|eukprot:EPY22032.1 hypothetical protein AGDE_13641 [Angomonas deanei]
MHYGTHEIALIPLTNKYFGKEEEEKEEEEPAVDSQWILDSTDGVFNSSVESICISSPSAKRQLRQQFIEIRNDPCVRYYHLRNYYNPEKPFESVNMDRLPGYVYSENDLDRFLASIEDSLFDTNAEFLEAGELHYDDHTAFFDEHYPTLTPEEKKEQFEECKKELGRWKEKDFPQQSVTPPVDGEKTASIHCSSSSATYTAPSSAAAADADFHPCTDPNPAVEIPSKFTSDFETYLWSTYPDKWNKDGEKRHSYGSMLKRGLGMVPVVAGFICGQGGELEEEGILIRNKRVNLIGCIGFSTTESSADDNIPYFQPRKVMVKAAGDRTLERVIMLAARYYLSTFCEAVNQIRPMEDPLALFHQRCACMRLALACKWNNYPTLKFIYDTGAVIQMSKALILQHAVSKEGEALLTDDTYSVKSYLYKKKDSDEKGVALLLAGDYVFHIWMYFMRYYVIPSSSGGGWTLHLTTDVAQVKDRKVVSWLSTAEKRVTEALGQLNAEAGEKKKGAEHVNTQSLLKEAQREQLLNFLFGNYFTFDEEEAVQQTSTFLGPCTDFVAYQLHMLHQEIIRARSMQAEDSIWANDHAFSSNGLKHYGIYRSPKSGPFLTTVQKGGVHDKRKRRTNNNVPNPPTLRPRTQRRPPSKPGHGQPDGGPMYQHNQLPGMQPPMNYFAPQYMGGGYYPCYYPYMPPQPYDPSAVANSATTPAFYTTTPLSSQAVFPSHSAPNYTMAPDGRDGGLSPVTSQGVFQSGTFTPAQSSLPATASPGQKDVQQYVQLPDGSICPIISMAAPSRETSVNKAAPAATRRKVASP